MPYISKVAGGLQDLYLGGCTSGLFLPSKIANIVSLYPWERYNITHTISSELYVRAYDSDDLESQTESFLNLLRWVGNLKGNTLIHCQAGLNRAGLLTALVLIAFYDFSGKSAIEHLRNKGSQAVLCNPTFERYVLNYKKGQA